MIVLLAIIIILLFLLINNIDILQEVSLSLSSFLQEQEDLIRNNDEISWNYLFILAFIMCIQTIIAPIPASVFLILAGSIYWNTSGFIGFFAAVIAAAVGNSIGAFICYFIGLKGGRPAARWFISEQMIQKGDVFFEKHGSAAVIIARMFPFAPADPIAYLAGINKFKFWPDYFFSIVISSIGLSIFYEGLGIIFDPQIALDIIDRYSSYATILFLVLTAFVAFWIFFFQKSDSSSTETIQEEKNIEK